MKILTTAMRNLPSFNFIAALLFLSSATPLQAQNKINFNEIELQAVFAQASYLPEANIEKLVKSSNFDLTFYAADSELQVAFFIVTNNTNKTQTISVRGTSNIDNAFIDLSLKLTFDKKTGLRLHEGFSLVAKKIYEALKPHLNRSYAINTTGHSLGGAVAFVLAAYLDKDGYKVGSVITFGQPKVTNFEGATALKHLDIKRIVLPHDLVPLVPPFDPLDIQNIDIYWHAGRELILLEDQQYTVIGGVDAMLRATKFTQRRLNEENLVHHQMPLYLKAVKSKIPVAKHVVYENSYNLFNIFRSN
jgi:triacylglycerol lipase